MRYVLSIETGDRKMTVVKLYQQIILISADNVKKLRGCDVDRVLEEADEQGCLEGFTAWLFGRRPDLSPER